MNCSTLCPRLAHTNSKWCWLGFRFKVWLVIVVSVRLKVWRADLQLSNDRCLRACHKMDTSETFRTGGVVFRNSTLCGFSRIFRGPEGMRRSADHPMNFPTDCGLRWIMISIWARPTASRLKSSESDQWSVSGHRISKIHVSLKHDKNTHPNANNHMTDMKKR